MPSLARVVLGARRGGGFLGGLQTQVRVWVDDRDGRLPIVRMEGEKGGGGGLQKGSGSCRAGWRALDACVDA